jgi:hypothetical protein
VPRTYLTIFAATVVLFSSTCHPRNPDASAVVTQEGPIHVTGPEVVTTIAGNVAEVYKLEAVTCKSRGKNFRDHGGKVLQNAAIQVIFWGSQWQQPARDQFAAKIRRAVASPYLTKVLPGRVNCPASLQFYWDNDVTPASQPNATVRQASTRAGDEILRLIKAGKVMLPSQTVDNAYLLVAPSGHYSGSGAFGVHSWRHLSTGPFMHYAVVDNRNSDQVTQTFSHELVEMMSDPRVNAFYGDDDGRCHQAKCEDADACPCFRKVQSNVAVTFYYSPGLACVAPDGLGGCSLPR